MDKNLYRKILSMVPIFKPLTPSELEEIVGISRLMRVNSGVTVIEEGEVGQAMYIIVEGGARVKKKLPGGETTTLDELGPRAVFGEMALIDQNPRSASVVTTSEALLYAIDLSAFNKLRDERRPAAFKVLREVAPTLCSRLRHINARISDFLRQPPSDLTEAQRRLLQESDGFGPLAQAEGESDAP